MRQITPHETQSSLAGEIVCMQREDVWIAISAVYGQLFLASERVVRKYAGVGLESGCSRLDLAASAVSPMRRSFPLIRVPSRNELLSMKKGSAHADEGSVVHH